jgi:hypothetical protein
LISRLLRRIDGKFVCAGRGRFDGIFVAARDALPVNVNVNSNGKVRMDDQPAAVETRFQPSLG